jgi:Flp pilus assembly protein TadG
MNSHNYIRQIRRGLFSGSARGQSMTEFAFAIPVLALLLVMGSDFARVFYFSIAVNNAARSGAQYGSQSLVTAADLNGMKAAATQDAPNLPALAATAQQCTCGAGSSVTACPVSYCTNNPVGNYVEVDTSMTFNTTITYPGIPSSLALTGKAIMQVQQQ